MIILIFLNETNSQTQKKSQGDNNLRTDGVFA
jgi:hypothetical protein